MHNLINVLLFVVVIFGCYKIYELCNYLIKQPYTLGELFLVTILGLLLVITVVIITYSLFSYVLALLAETNQALLDVAHLYIGN